MIDRVSFAGTTFNELPFKFEAGTSNYIGAIGLAEAMKYLISIGLEKIEAYERSLHLYAQETLLSIEGIKIYGEAVHKHPIYSFLLKDIHPFDAGLVLDKLGIAVRTGTHCAMPLMDHFGIDGTIRASLCFYNTKSEIDRLKEGIILVQEMFG